MGVGSSFLDQLPEGGVDALIKDLDKRAKRISKKRSKSTVVQSIEQPDGKILEKRSDGSQRRVSPDGTSVETFKDGSVLKKTKNIVLCKFEDGSMLQISDLGDIIQKDKEGTQLQLLENQTLLILAHADGRQLQWDVKLKTGTEDRPDGSKLEWNEDAGNRVELLVDGTIITTYSDGCVITKQADGKLEQANPDGTRIISFPDGRRIQYNADGSRIEFFPDGSRVDYRADGVVIKQGSAAQAKMLNNGVNWDLAAHSASVAGDDQSYNDDFSQFSDSEFEDAEVGENDALVKGSFVLRGGRFQDPKKLNNVETKILKEALSVIPYEMGLDVNARDVLITAEPGTNGTMKIMYAIRLSADECDVEMAEEVHEEVEESLTEKGGTVFTNSLARTAKELNYARLLTDSFSTSYSSAESDLTIPDSWKREEVNEPTVVNEGTGDSSTLGNIADIAMGKSKGSGKLSAMRRKLRRANKFKTLQGSIKIKGVSGSDFDRSNHHNKALRAGLCDIFQHLGLNESNLRIKLTNVLDSPRKDGKDCASVDYHVTLRGNAKDQAEAVVSSLKKVFGDSTERKKFLSNYWNRIPPEVGVSPSRKKRSKSSSPHKSAKTDPFAGLGSEAKDEAKRGKRGKKDKKKRDKKRRSSGARGSESDSSDISPKSGERFSAMNMLSSLASAILQDQTIENEPKEQNRMLPVLN